MAEPKVIREVERMSDPPTARVKSPVVVKVVVAPLRAILVSEMLTSPVEVREPETARAPATVKVLPES